MTSDSGLAVIRSAVLIRAKRGHLANLARDHAISIPALEEFAHGRARLSPDTLSALASELFGANVSYDPQIDRLRRTTQEASPLGIAPPPVDPKTTPKFTGGPPTMYPSKKPEPKGQRRVQRGQRS